jgi:hypothetical protein
MADGNPHADAAALMVRVNATLEAWIRDRPEQWLWCIDAGRIRGARSTIGVIAGAMPQLGAGQRVRS